jgi:hypothetical protein
MKMYTDPELKNEMKSINFGIVDAGTCKDLKVYILNDSDAMLTNLKFQLPVIEGLIIVDAPITIQSKQKAVLTLKWCPTMKFKQALVVTLGISGDEVYLAPVTV